MLYFAAKSLVDEFYVQGLFFKRPLVEGFKGVFAVFAGDVLEVFFFKKGQSFSFEGLCLAVRGKGFKKPDTSLILRNFIYQVGVECLLAYFYNRVYMLRIHDFKKKDYLHPRAKFFFLRRGFVL